MEMELIMLSKRPSDVENDPEKFWKLNANPWEHGGNQSNAPEDHAMLAEGDSTKTYSFFRHLKIQTIIALVLLVVIFAASQFSNSYIDKGKVWLNHELQTSINFVAVAGWYENIFSGSPSFIPSFGNKSELVLAKHNQDVEAVAPIQNGILLHSFAQLLNGVEIAGDSNAVVHAVAKGRVILVREQQDSVIIQHADNRMSIYTRLNEVNVEVSDWVEAGASIGKLAPIADEDYSVLFLAMKQGEQYIDPLEVISVE